MRKQSKRKRKAAYARITATRNNAARQAAERRAAERKAAERKKAEKRMEVVLMPYAWRVINAYFGWGTAGIYNQSEQICALGGRVIGNTIRVEAALPMLSASSSPAHVMVKAETWLCAIWALKDMNMDLVGSVHSHPNGLSVFCSMEDRQTHLRMFPRGTSVVLNPQREELAAFDATWRRISVRLGEENRQKGDCYGNIQNPEGSGYRLENPLGGGGGMDAVSLVPLGVFSRC